MKPVITEEMVNRAAKSFFGAAWPVGRSPFDAVEEMHRVRRALEAALTEPEPKPRLHLVTSKGPQ